MPDLVTSPAGVRRRRLRAVFAADAANFGGLVSSDETGTLEDLWRTRRLAREELDANGGWLFGMPGDGIFALFESAVDAVRCALLTQSKLASVPNVLKLRIGVHLGEVLFQDELPFGESLIIAARLESLAEPGGILVSAAVMDAVAPRISATFERCGVKSLKHSPRRITTFSVKSNGGSIDLQPTSVVDDPFESTADLNRTSRGTETTRRGKSRKGRRLAGDDTAVDATAYDLGQTGKPRAPAKRETGSEATKQSEAVKHGNRQLDQTGRLGKTQRASSDKLSATPRSAGRGGGAPASAPQLPALTGKAAQRASNESYGVRLNQALTTYLGPFARVVIKRHVAEAINVADLVERLAGEIAAKRDRDAFLKLAHAIIDRPAS